nr:hypothetical protein GCM10010200_007720 [Actinomadura rugatobispora]
MIEELDPRGRPSHIAEAAHIVAEKVDGPRGEGSRPDAVNGLPNLILLCPSDHRLIDKRPDLWPLDKLRALKREHESWTLVASRRPPTSPSVVPYEPPRAPGIRPDEVVRVDREPYRVAGPGAEERMDDGATVWSEAPLFGEGRHQGHFWLRRLESTRETPAAGALRTAVADEVALLDDLAGTGIPGIPVLRAVEMTVHVAAIVTGLPVRTSIRDVFKDGRPLTREEIVLCCDGLPALCGALGELHERGLAHRRLAPESVLMSRDGALSLRDVGAATVPPRPGERSDPFHAPEQGSGGGPPGPATDVHRLARVMYEVLTGRRPGRRDRHPSPSALNPALPPEADLVLLRALAADPAARGEIRTFGTRLKAAARGSRPRG